MSMDFQRIIIHVIIIQKKTLNQYSITTKKNPMKVFHVNIGTFEPKSIELAAYLKSLKYSFQVIALTEIGQTSQEFIEFIFPNFEIYMMEAPSTKGG